VSRTLSGGSRSGLLTTYKKSFPEEVAALVRALLTAGADAAIRDRDGKTACEIATEAGLTGAAALLS
jgi:hypothetical protein